MKHFAKNVTVDATLELDSKVFMAGGGKDLAY